MLKSGDHILVPLQVLSDFFLSHKNTFVQYNGKGVYMLANNSPTKTPELCNILEARYGLRKAHDIVTFDSYFARRGLRDEFLSGELVRIEKAQQMMGVMLFEDFHSASISASPYCKTTVTSDKAMVSPIFLNRIQNNQALVQKRKSLLGENLSHYERRGDTVFITFDDFNINSIAEFYTEGFEPDPESGDTIELFAYALRRLQNEDSDVKNVVVDIACNGGGTSLSCGYVIEALIGTCIICLQNPNTRALSQTVIKFDLNLDGVIDENDLSMKALGKNVALIISDNSFSCGNLLPCAVDSLDSNVLLLGQTSGGGACEVGYLTTMLGSKMQFSMENMLVTMKNGSIRDIDGGVDPEIPLSTARMFDRDYIVSVVDEYFG